MKKSKILALALAVVAALASSLYAAPRKTVAIPDPGPNGKRVEIKFWYSTSGAQGKAIGEIVENFNKSQNKITLIAEFQGSYDDALIKLKASAQSKTTPNLMQVYGIGTRWMIDSDLIVPLGDFTATDNYDTSMLVEDIADYYRANESLYSMPFNASTPVLYYNKKHFREAGLDPTKPPTTMDEVLEYSKKLYKKDGDKVRYGVCIAIYGWWFEQWMTKQGLMYANNGNGRTKHATKVEFDTNGGAKNILEKWIAVASSPSALNVGRSTEDALKAFNSGNASMTIASTANIGTSMVSMNKDEVDFGVAFFPGISKNDKGGVSQGGASIWIMKSDPVKEQASYEAIKYLANPKSQVLFATKVGNMPVIKSAYEDPDYLQYLEKNPAFKVAIDQLRKYPGSVGPVLGVFAEARQNVEKKIEAVLNKEMSIDAAIAAMASEINAMITRYNKVAGVKP